MKNPGIRAIVRTEMWKYDTGKVETRCRSFSELVHIADNTIRGYIENIKVFILVAIFHKIFSC